MKAQRVYAVLLRQIFLMRGSATRVVPLFAWVAVDILLWGFMSRYLNSVATPGYNFVPALLGAVLLWDFLTRVMQGVTMAFFEDVWSRNFLNVFGSPITVPEYLSGLVLSSVISSSIGLIVMLILATSVFGLSFFSYGLALYGFIFVLFLFGIALGIFGTGVVLRLGPAAEWFIWPIPAILSPFVSVFYPIGTLPMWMQAVGRCLPASYVFEGVRAIAAGHGVNWLMLAGSTLLAAAYILLACWFFARTHRHVLKTGLIARYSAETVS